MSEHILPQMNGGGEDLWDAIDSIDSSGFDSTSLTLEEKILASEGHNSSFDFSPLHYSETIQVPTINTSSNGNLAIVDWGSSFFEKEIISVPMPIVYWNGGYETTQIDTPTEWEGNEVRAIDEVIISHELTQPLEYTDGIDMVYHTHIDPETGDIILARTNVESDGWDKFVAGFNQNFENRAYLVKSDGTVREISLHFEPGESAFIDFDNARDLDQRYSYELKDGFNINNAYLTELLKDLIESERYSDQISIFDRIVKLQEDSSIEPTRTPVPTPDPTEEAQDTNYPRITGSEFDEIVEADPVGFYEFWNNHIANAVSIDQSPLDAQLDTWYKSLGGKQESLDINGQNIVVEHFPVENYGGGDVLMRQNIGQEEYVVIGDQMGGALLEHNSISVAESQVSGFMGVFKDGEGYSVKYVTQVSSGKIGIEVAKLELKDINTYNPNSEEMKFDNHWKTIGAYSIEYATPQTEFVFIPLDVLKQQGYDKIFNSQDFQGLDYVFGAVDQMYRNLPKIEKYK